MRLLLDTHSLVWWLERPRRLAREAYAAIEEPDNEIFVSAVSVWEISIKSALAKLRPSPDLTDELDRVGFAPLPVTWEHAAAVAVLPLRHRDPFDRLLIAQAKLEALTVLTRDPVFEEYGVQVLVS
jgi:PIN domain nuclease of toxin-antitoxin system